MNIQGKYALITGGARRIGKAIAIHLAQKGAHILLHYHRSADDAKATMQEIQQLGVECHLIQADLSDVQSLPEKIKRIQDQLQISILINSASVFYKTNIETLDISAVDTLIETNLKAPFVFSSLLGTQMKRNGLGKIVNITDWSASRPYKDYSVYCASKGGLTTLTKALARDLAPHVSVNAIAPGPIMQPENISSNEADQIAKLTALGRWGHPKDIAHAVYFLLDNDYINASVLVVDGGRSITL